MEKNQQKKQKFKKVAPNLLIFEDECLGQGACGQVFKGAYYDEFGLNDLQPLAIKQTNIPALDRVEKDDVQLKVLMGGLAEVKFMQQFHHPNIVKFIDAIKTQSHLYLIIEFCNGGNLKSFLKKKGRLREQEALFYFGQIIDAFRYLRWDNKKMMHRDIKPENILVQHRGKDILLKLTDFGTAKETSQSTNTFVGTQYFQSPQMMKGEGDKNVDIWSLGITLYFMLYFDPQYQRDYDENNLPWYKNNFVALSEHIAKNPEVNFPEKQDFKISEQVKQLIRDMLKINAAERISWTDLFNNSLLISNLYTKEGKLKVEDQQPLIQYNIFTTLQNTNSYSTLNQKSIENQQHLLNEQDFQKLFEQTEQNLKKKEKATLCKIKIEFEISIVKFIMNTSKSFYDQNNKNKFQFHQIKLIKLQYILSKMAFMYINRLQLMFQNNINHIQAPHEEWMNLIQDKNQFTLMKNEINKYYQFIIQYYQKIYAQTQEPEIKSQLGREESFFTVDGKLDRNFRALIIYEFFPEFFPLLGQIKDSIKTKQELNPIQKTVLHLIENILMIYTYDITFSWNSQNNFVDIDKFIQERNVYPDQGQIFARIIQAFYNLDVLQN